VWLELVDRGLLRGLAVVQEVVEVAEPGVAEAALPVVAEVAVAAEVAEVVGVAVAVRDCVHVLMLMVRLMLT
jgi:hypothetical protein